MDSNLTQDQQDKLTTSELRYYQLNYGEPLFERRMKRLIDSMGADTASRFGEKLVQQIMRMYGNTELTEKYTRRLNLVVCDCEHPHFVGAQKSCRGLNGVGATGIFAK
tara:strand:- start:374 stop:697 length:324 start_codon:yes stop_codon:yes gene_type:complete